MIILVKFWLSFCRVVFRLSHNVFVINFSSASGSDSGEYGSILPLPKTLISDAQQLHSKGLQVDDCCTFRKDSTDEVAHIMSHAG